MAEDAEEVAEAWLDVAEFCELSAEAADAAAAVAYASAFVTLATVGPLVTLPLASKAKTLLARSVGKVRVALRS